MAWFILCRKCRTSYEVGTSCWRCTSIKVFGALLLMCTTAFAEGKTYTWKLGTPVVPIRHGCATARAAKAFEDFLKLDPTFVMNDKGSSFTVTMPTKDGKGTHEKSYASTITIDHTLAEWAAPWTTEHQQVRIKADFSVFHWIDEAHPRAFIELINDYDPDETGTHPNICTERLYVNVVRL